MVKTIFSIPKPVAGEMETSSSDDFQKWLCDDTLRWSLWAWAAQELERRRIAREHDAANPKNLSEHPAQPR